VPTRSEHRCPAFGFGPKGEIRAQIVPGVMVRYNHAGFRTKVMGTTREKIAKRYVISGRVQGVGFRFFAEHAARRLGICGYVKNRWDGKVEVYAIGDETSLEAHGVPASQVSRKPMRSWTNAARCSRSKADGEPGAARTPDQRFDCLRREDMSGGTEAADS
jgi:acylphosphatase